MSLNKVMLIGNVGKDPEVRYLDGGAQGGSTTKVATFTLATTERYRDRNGEIRENTEWHNIVAWRNSADLAEKYIHKGSQVFIEGKLRTRSWTDQSGQKRYTTEVTVDNIQLLGKKSDNPASEIQGSASQAPAARPVQNAPAAQSSPAFQSGMAPAAGYSAPSPDLDNPTDDLPF
ncbi:MAG: single-stranded DNA-binding protein [Candidatus Cryptobacteroides sp.]